MEILNKLNLASNEIFVGPGTGKVLMPVPANGATETLATISNINTHKFTSGININDKSFITSSIGNGELKVLHRNGNSVSNNGFIVRTVDVDNSSIHRLELLTTDGYSSYQYNFPLKNGNVVLDSDLTSKADVSSVYTKDEADNRFLQHIYASLANDSKGNIIDESNTAVGKLEYNQSGTLFFKFGNSGSTFLAGDDSGMYTQYKDQLDANTTYRVDFPKKSGVLATIEDLGGINSFFSDALDAQGERIEALEDAPTPTLSNTEGDLTVTTSANIYGFYGTLKMFGITGGNIDIKELSAKNRADTSSTNASMSVWARILKNVNNTWVVAAQSKTSHKWSEAGASEFVNFEMQPVSGVGISAYEKVAIVFVDAENAPATSSNGQFSFSVAAGLGGGALVSALASTPTATASSASVTPIFKFKYFQFGDTEETLKLTGGTLTGALKTPTPAAGTNNTTVATTAFVNTALADYVKTEDIPEVDSTKFLNIDYPGYTQEVAGPVKFYPTRGTLGPSDSRFVSIEKAEDDANSPKLVMSSYDGETTRLIEFKPGTNSILNSVQTLDGEIPPPFVTTFSAELKLPEKSGTLALTSDIPDVSSYATKSYVDEKSADFIQKEFSGIQTITSDLEFKGYVLVDNLILDELEIESLTASSKVTLSGGLDVSNGLVADSIKVGSDDVALAKDIPAPVDAYTKSESDAKYLILNNGKISELNFENSNIRLPELSSGKIESISNGLKLSGSYSGQSTSIELLGNYINLISSGTIKSNSSIEINGVKVATVNDIPDVSSYIDKDVSDLTNYETKTVAEGKYAQKSDITNVYKYVGSVNTYSALPTSGQKAGDVYNIVNADAANNISAGDNVAWTGSAWDKLGGSVDLSNYAQKSTTLSGYGITNAYTKTETDSKYLKLTNTEDELVNVGFSNHKGVKFTFQSDISGSNVGFGAPEESEIDDGRIFEVRAANALGYDNSIKFDPLNSAIIKKVTNPSSIAAPTPPTTPPGVPTTVEYALSIPNKNGTIATLGDIPEVPDVSSKADKATTLSGYGITDAYTKTDVDNSFAKKTDIPSESETLLIPLSEFELNPNSTIIDGKNNSHWEDLGINVYVKDFSKNWNSSNLTVDIFSEYPSVELFRKNSSMNYIFGAVSTIPLNKKVNADIYITDIYNNLFFTKGEKPSAIVIVLEENVDIQNINVSIKGIKYKTVSYHSGNLGDQ